MTLTATDREESEAFLKEYFSSSIRGDLWSTFIGDMLGAGMSRKVYELEHNPQFVIKVETEGGRFQNVNEWETWQELQFHDDTAKWLAPCINISPNGVYLVQRRVVPVKKSDMNRLPAQIPHFLDDNGARNWGWLEGRLVRCDYGTNLMRTKGTTKRMVKAKWDVWFPHDWQDLKGINGSLK